MVSALVEFLGWFGAVTVLAGYLLFSTGKLANGPVYQLFNLVGGLSVAVNVAAHHAVPSTIVNSIWALVAVVVLVRMARARRGGHVLGSDRGAALPAEPIVTTAVLPVIGPALRGHEANGSDTVTDAPVSGGPAPCLQAEQPTQAAPLTESVPVITATIALAIVAAAQQQGQQQAQQQGQQHQSALRDHSANPER